MRGPAGDNHQSFITHLSLFIIPHAPLIVHRSFLIHHSSFLIPQSSPSLIISFSFAIIILHHLSFIVTYHSHRHSHSPSFIMYRSSCSSTHHVIHSPSFIIHHLRFTHRSTMLAHHHSSPIIYHSSFITHHSSFIEKSSPCHTRYCGNDAREQLFNKCEVLRADRDGRLVLTHCFQCQDTEERVRGVFPGSSSP